MRADPAKHVGTSVMKAVFLEKWVARIRFSIATLAPEFSSNRVLRDYVEQYYLSASTQYQQHIDNNVLLAKELTMWETQLAKHWLAIYMQNLHIESSGS